MSYTKLLLLLLLALASQYVPAQTPLPLTSLEAFVPPGSNWQIAGAVSAGPEDSQFKTQAGTGILVNLPTNQAQSNLLTDFTHGDLDLSLAFMLPAGSNSGIYLMGRYEIQLFDSWGKSHPSFGDCGGIYQRWDDTQPAGAQGYEGYPPRVNACRAPGLWQQLELAFQAPRFDAAGRKVQNARLLRVHLNGVLIHEEVELTGPTRGAIFAEEAPLGPILIQGDHGPVAFRDIRYQPFGQAEVQLSPLDYTVYRCTALNLPPLDQLSPLRQGRTATLNQEVAGETQDFVVVFTGEITVPTAGKYAFTLDARRYGELYVDDAPVVTARGEATGATELTAGTHAIRIVYFKDAPWFPNGLGLYVAGPEMRPQALHALGSLPLDNPEAPIYVEPGAQARLLRSFVDYRDSLGTPARRITHAIQVGLPTGLAFTYDLDRATWVWGWKGPFLDATPMWLDRGDASSRPRGLLQALGDAAGLGALPSAGAIWPDTLAAAWDFEGYELEADGLPTFHYRQGAAQFSDRIDSPDGQTLRRTANLEGTPGQAYALRLASARQVETLGRGLYRLDGQYYVQTAPKQTVHLHTQGPVTHLMAPLTPGNSLAYSLKW